MTSEREETMFRLTIETDNAAFEDDGELARILRRLADKVDAVPAGWDHGNVMDTNGNNVGEWEMTR
jgi:hypothetical protein